MKIKPGFFARLKLAWLVITQKYELCIERCDICGGFNIQPSTLFDTDSNTRTSYYECLDCGSIAVVKEVWRKKVD